MKAFIAAIFTCILLGNVYFPAFSGNDFVEGKLRTDLANVNSARDYKGSLYAHGLPNTTGNDFTTSWLSINLDDEPGLFGHDFTQVRLM